MSQGRLKVAANIASTSLKKGWSKRQSREVAAYLMSEGLTSEIDSIMRDVQADWAEAGYVEVIASSAHPITASIRAEINRQVKKLYPSAKKVMITEVNDPQIIGGVRLSMPNQQLDLSVEAQLNKFKQLTSAGKEQ